MKYILIALLALAACSKSNNPVGSVCWTCSFGNNNGLTRPDTTICTDGRDPKPRETDEFGNDWGYFCEKN